MRYVSTRGEAPELEFGDVLLTGLAADGGLYVPAEWPRLGDVWTVPDATYVDIAVDVMAPFVEPTLTSAELRNLCEAAYASFDTPEVTPLVELGDGIHLMELFHGPTLAFKDVALQLVGQLFDHELSRRDRRATIVCATSGDTGSAAIEACRGRSALDIFVLHPAGRTSEVQRRQMTSVDEPNVHNFAVDGTFDDCQDLVKALNADADFKARHGLSAMNSINWARVMAQVVYYVVAARAVGATHERPVSFSVPTGNFGNVLAGWVARQMGCPIDRLIVASNSNDILTRFLETGEMRVDGVVPTLSPSMDIQISSNFERLLFEVMGRDGARVATSIEQLRSAGGFKVSENELAEIRAVFSGERFDDESTLAAIAAEAAASGVTVDPHTAVGVAAARSAMRGGPLSPLVVLATAHPAKFPDAVDAAIGVRPELPEHLADLFERPEHMTAVAADVDSVAALVDERRS